MLIHPDFQTREEQRGEEVRVDVRGLVMEVRPALEAVGNGTGGWAVSVEDVTVVLVPGRDLVEGEQHELVHFADCHVGLHRFFIVGGLGRTSFPWGGLSRTDG